MNRMKSPEMLLKAYVKIEPHNYILEVGPTLLREAVVRTFRIQILEEKLENANSGDELRTARTHGLLDVVVHRGPVLWPFALDELRIDFRKLGMNIIRVRVALHIRGRGSRKP